MVFLWRLTPWNGLDPPRQQRMSSLSTPAAVPESPAGAYTLRRRPMSEKLLDSFLGWSFPFYSGSTYADNVFPKGSFARIDMYDPDRSIATIQSNLQSNSYERSLESIGKARTLVLDELNLFAVLCKAFDSMNSRVLELPPRNAKSTTLLPKRESVRLSVRRLMRAMSLAA